jgi:hypothetical protein
LKALDSKILLFALVALCCEGVLWGQTNLAFGSGKGYRMNYGPALGYTINCRLFTNTNEPDNLVLKGLAVRVGASNEATVCFDTELLRYAAGWTGGFLDISRTHLDTYKGSTEAFMEGKAVFRTPPLFGWSVGTNMTDPRPLHVGPLPDCRFKGHYKHRDRVVLRYTVYGAEVHELPAFASTKGQPQFQRKITVERCSKDLFVAVADGNVQVSVDGDAVRALNSNGTSLVRVPAHEQPLTFTVSIGSDTRLAVPNPQELTKGGPPLWPETLATRGRVGFGGPYVVDTLTCPEENPWHSWLRFVAMDFFSDGRAALSTWNGDVWIVSGIDSQLKELKWKRFAAGLFEPLGLKIVKDQLYVLERSQITRLHDLNGDGEADYYENFNNDAAIGPSYHAFAFELQTDRAGNFYYVRCGQRVDPALPLSGGLVRVASDGSRSELTATGLRAANGLSVGPNDEITTADNQGNWIPTSRIDFIQPGGFYGYVPHAKTASAPTDYRKPFCWIPYAADNSSGSQIWVTSEKWGPLSGQLLHTSYGKGTLFLVLRDGTSVEQGGVVQFPLRFETGIMRGKFHPLDGQLYVCGLKGWQTAGARDAALHRVRYTGGKVRMPESLRVSSDGISIGFTCALHESAADPQNFGIEQWNYVWSDKYGSPEFSVKDRNRQGHDPVAIESVSLSADRKSVLLKVPDLKPVMQMQIQFRIKAEDGTQIAQTIYNTVNSVPH